MSTGFKQVRCAKCREMKPCDTAGFVAGWECKDCRRFALYYVECSSDNVGWVTSISFYNPNHNQDLEKSIEDAQEGYKKSIEDAQEGEFPVLAYRVINTQGKVVYLISQGNI